MSAESHAPRNPDSAIRRALLWWFQAPATAHVSVNVAIDFTAARAYLDQLDARDGVRVSVQHLLCAAIGRTLAAWPLANAQIIGNRIRMRDRVGVATPVNLLGHPGGRQRELGLMLIEDCDRLSLREIAARSRRTVSDERAGRSSNGMVAFFVRLAEGAPQPLFFRAMDIYERLRRWPWIQDRLFRAAPATTLLSNVGAPFDARPGVLFRGAALAPPARLAHAGTVWGISTIQDEAVVVDGRVEVRPMLPVVLIFDHRLIDGVVAGKLVMHLASILDDPAAVFGRDGMVTAEARVPIG